MQVSKDPFEDLCQVLRQAKTDCEERDVDPEFKVRHYAEAVLPLITNQVDVARHDAYEDALKSIESDDSERITELYRQVSALRKQISDADWLDALLDSIEAAFVSIDFRPEHLEYEAVVMGYDSSWAHRGRAETRREAVLAAITAAKKEATDATS